MFGILKVLAKAALELKRIREILEIVHHDKLVAYEYYTKMDKQLKDSDREFIAREPDVDVYGEVVERNE